MVPSRSRPLHPGRHDVVSSLRVGVRLSLPPFDFRRTISLQPPDGPQQLPEQTPPTRQTVPRQFARRSQLVDRGRPSIHAGKTHQSPASKAIVCWRQLVTGALPGDAWENGLERRVQETKHDDNATTPHHYQPGLTPAPAGYYSGRSGVWTQLGKGLITTPATYAPPHAPTLLICTAPLEALCLELLREPQTVVSTPPPLKKPYIDIKIV